MFVLAGKGNRVRNTCSKLAAGMVRRGNDGTEGKKEEAKELRQLSSKGRPGFGRTSSSFLLLPYFVTSATQSLSWFDTFISLILTPLAFQLCTNRHCSHEFIYRLSEQFHSIVKQSHLHLLRPWMEPKPPADEASKDPGVLTTHHSFTNDDIEGKGVRTQNFFFDFLISHQDTANMPCMPASTFPVITDAVDTIGVITDTITEMELGPRRRESQKENVQVRNLICVNTQKRC